MFRPHNNRLFYSFILVQQKKKRNRKSWNPLRYLTGQTSSRLWGLTWAVWTLNFYDGRMKGGRQGGKEKCINGNRVLLWFPNRGRPGDPAPWLASRPQVGLVSSGPEIQTIWTQRDRWDSPWKCCLWKTQWERKSINIQYDVNYSTTQRRVDTQKLTVWQQCGCGENGPALTGC